MDTFPEVDTPPSWGLTQKAEFSVRSIKFADGYEQRRPSGINSVTRSWSLSWNLISKGEKDLINDFLLSKKGVEAFVWDVPEAGETVRVVCRKAPSFSYDSYGNYSISAEFREDFGP